MTILHFPGTSHYQRSRLASLGHAAMERHHWTNSSPGQSPPSVINLGHSEARVLRDSGLQQTLGEPIKFMPSCEVRDEDFQPLVTPPIAYGQARPTCSSQVRTLLWWVPELAAAIISVATFACIVVLLRVFDHRRANETQLVGSVTLNGVITALATLNRALLLTPVCSAIVQEMWLHLVDEAKRPSCASRLGDLQLFVDASNGAWSSIVFLVRQRRGSRSVCRIQLPSLDH